MVGRRSGRESRLSHRSRRRRRAGSTPHRKVEVKVEFLDDGDYERSLQRISGRLEVDARWSRARSRPAGWVISRSGRATSSSRDRPPPGSSRNRARRRDDVAVTLGPGRRIIRCSRGPGRAVTRGGRSRSATTSARWNRRRRPGSGWTSRPTGPQRGQARTGPGHPWTSADELRFRTCPALTVRTVSSSTCRSGGACRTQRRHPGTGSGHRGVADRGHAADHLAARPHPPKLAERGVTA